MSQINSNIKDDFQVVLLLSCFVGHPVSKHNRQLSKRLLKPVGFLERNKI